jgi:hypothetical protein
MHHADAVARPSVANWGKAIEFVKSP